LLYIIHININGLRNKVEYLENYIKTLDFIPQIIAISEIRLYDNELKYFNIPGYNSFFCTRNSKVKQSVGGVGLFINENFKI